MQFILEYYWPNVVDALRTRGCVHVALESTAIVEVRMSATGCVTVSVLPSASIEESSEATASIAMALAAPHVETTIEEVFGVETSEERC